MTGARRKVLIAGASGFLGRHLASALEDNGFEVARLVRAVALTGPHAVFWDPAGRRLDRSALDGVAAVVNLCGANIAGRRWSPAFKRDLRTSRVSATRLLADTIAAAEGRRPILINASAVGIYGDRGDDLVDERSPPGTGFLAEMASDWEAATRAAAEVGARVVLLRMGLVIGPGGALDRMLLPYRLGLGGPVGGGRQWWPWVALDDVLCVVRRVLESDDLTGPVNVVSPERVTSREFARILGRVLRRPAFLPVPGFVLRLAVGEIAESLLGGTQVEPRRLTEAGYQFAAAELEDAFRRAFAAR